MPPKIKKLCFGFEIFWRQNIGFYKQMFAVARVLAKNFALNLDKIHQIVMPDL
jgi:hypothetical protein